MPRPDVRLVERARTLRSDVAAEEVSAALTAADVPVVLLKGPAIADWLYDEGERVYVDCDLLVPRHRLEVAERVLGGLGFVSVDEGLEQPGRALLHSQPWVRERDYAQIDLHMTLFGVGVSPEQTWAELVDRTEEFRLGDTPMRMLKPAARTLHVALHALQHEDRTGRPLEDLARALEHLPLEVWEEAARLADRLDATPTFALGLGRLPAGRELCGRLGIVTPELAREATSRGSSATLAVGFERLARAGGLRSKARVLARELVPTREFIRWWSPLARRGSLGVLLAYLYRPIWLLGHALPSLAAWRRYRKQA
jgi:hypothetical protein